MLMTINTGPLIPVPQYIGVSDADDYFTTRLRSTSWFLASQSDKQAALVTATRAIDQLNFVGIKANDTQQLAFPRLGLGVSDTVNNFTFTNVTVPKEILIACCEEAIVRLDDIDPEFEIGNLRLTSTGYGTVRETYSRAHVSEAVIAGIMSLVAWNFLIPWLAD